MKTCSVLRDAPTNIIGNACCTCKSWQFTSSIELIRPLLIGESAIDPAAVAEKLHQNTFWQGRGGSITHTISGIDIALWDILGKVTKQPISRLLGGCYCPWFQ